MGRKLGRKGGRERKKRGGKLIKGKMETWKSRVEERTGGKKGKQRKKREQARSMRSTERGE